MYKEGREVSNRALEFIWGDIDYTLGDGETYGFQVVETISVRGEKGDLPEKFK